jgi:hypothetical protein
MVEIVARSWLLIVRMRTINEQPKNEQRATI